MKPLISTLVGLLITAGCVTSPSPSAIARPPIRTLDIQKLLDSPPSNGVVHIPRGTYVFKRGLTIAQNNTTLQCDPGTWILVSDVNENVINIKKVTNIRVENAHLAHQKPLKTYQCHGSVVALEESEDVTLTNCELNGCGAIGVDALFSTNLVVQNCWIHENTFNAIYLQNCGKVRLWSNVIENNAHDFQVYQAEDLESSDNVIRNNGGYWRKRDPHPGLLNESGKQ